MSKSKIAGFVHILPSAELYLTQHFVDKKQKQMIVDTFFVC